MKKTLYSLMLNDEVVAEVDRLAHRLGTNRSNLINQILAEHVNYVTPERRINDILTGIDRLMSPSRELVPFFVPNAVTMSLKSSLQYKYRPTVKYEVELYRGDEDALGELSVVFRTQSALLLQSMAEFFRLWRLIEETHLAPLLGSVPGYSLCDGRFSRSIALPTCTTMPPSRTAAPSIGSPFTSVPLALWRSSRIALPSRTVRIAWRSLTSGASKRMRHDSPRPMK